MSLRYQRSALSVVVATLFTSVSFSSFAAPVTADTILAQDRAAKGNITEFGGARRITSDQTEALKAALNNHQAKNVILFIGDGMGDSEITVARNYAEGAGGFFKGIDALPMTGQYTHYSLDRKTQKPNYVTDSAASATAWASGVKTYNGALGIDVFGKDHQTILELAKANGKATGNVTTSEIQDATPAALFSHVTGRKCYGPVETLAKCSTNALENGGRGSISEQLLVTRADITLGGGAKSFAQTATAGEYKGKTLEQQAIERGYQIVKDAKSLEAITLANQDKPVLGLFHDGNMAVAWEGPKATYQGNLKNPPLECKPNSKLDPNAPTLAQMTKKAIDLLKTNENGSRAI